MFKQITNFLLFFFFFSENDDPGQNGVGGICHDSRQDKWYVDCSTIKMLTT